MTYLSNYPDGCSGPPADPYTPEDIDGHRRDAAGRVYFAMPCRFCGVTLHMLPSPDGTVDFDERRADHTDACPTADHDVAALWFEDAEAEADRLGLFDQAPATEAEAHEEAI